MMVCLVDLVCFVYSVNQNNERNEINPIAEIEGENARGSEGGGRTKASRKGADGIPLFILGYLPITQQRADRPASTQR